MTGIYKITNIVNGKVYVGSALDVFNIRIPKHKRDLINLKHHSIKLQRSYDKYGIDNFKFELIEECKKEQLIEREQYYIDLYDSYKNGYNCSPKAGSSMGRPVSEETKKKISEINKGKNTWSKGRLHTEAEKIKIGLSQKGRKRSDTTKEKISQANKGKKHSEETKNKISIKNKGKSSTLGYKFSQESKIKMRESALGRVASNETKMKMSILNRGRNNKRYNPTPILQYDKNGIFIKEWKDLISLKEAGLDSCAISKVCRDKKKNYLQYIWKFKKL